MIEYLPARSRVATFALGLTIVLTLGWPQGATTAIADDLDLQVRPVVEGLDRVLADGVGHAFDDRPVRDLAIGGDGTIWAIQGRRVLELGRAGSTQARSERWGQRIRRLEVTPNGELWASEDGGAVVQLVGDEFEDRSAGRRGWAASLAALPNGQIWRTVRDANGEVSVVGSSDGRTWVDVPTTGLDRLLGAGAAHYSFAQTQDGRVWIGVDRGQWGGGLAVLDEAGWQLLESVVPGTDLRVRAMQPSPDGSLWVLADVGRPGPRTRHVLVHLDQGEVEVMGEADGVPQDSTRVWTGWSPLEPAALAIDPSGRAWFSVGDVGLWSYHDSEFERVDLPALRKGALDLEVAPSGELWIVDRKGHIYRGAASTRP